MQQNEISSNITSGNPSDNIETYTFDKDKRVYIVEPVYKDNGTETVTSILTSLIKAESGKH